MPKQLPRRPVREEPEEEDADFDGEEEESDDDGRGKKRKGAKAFVDEAAEVTCAVVVDKHTATLQQNTEWLWECFGSCLAYRSRFWHWRKALPAAFLD
jgi:hypothetical protein